jgi:phenylacetate-CoA ligase
MQAKVGLGETAFAQRVFLLPRTDAAIATFDYRVSIMSVNFTLKSFFHPIAIVKLRRGFERSQWFTPDQFNEYQEELLRRILEHAYATVPYYRDLFQRLHLCVTDFRTVADLQKLPILSKAEIRKHFESLRSKSADSFGAHLVRTSGTSCQPVSFLLDTPANVLEFVYYWRHWSWAGYTLGMRFAEFASDYFLGNPDRSQRPYFFQKLTNRLLLNSISLSEPRVGEYIRAIRHYRPLFLKGLASVLHIFAHFARRLGYDDLRFRAVFSTGEMLLTRQRKDIEDVFKCKVYDSYGHMERTVAVSECPAGGFHINPEYGILELMPLPETEPRSFVEEYEAGIKLARIVGTGLHNFSMPLIRYETGDVAEVLADAGPCACGRHMARIRRVNGRRQDAIVTRDGRVITTLFLVFDKVPGILSGQIIQCEPARLLIRIARTEEYTAQSEADLLNYVRQFVGPAMSIALIYVHEGSVVWNRGTKYRAVISYVSSDSDYAGIVALSPLRTSL